MRLPRPWFPESGPFLLPVLFTLVLPLVSPTKSVDYSTWLMLNYSCKMMCLFININAGPLVYCTHGSDPYYTNTALFAGVSSSLSCKVCFEKTHTEEKK